MSRQLTPDFERVVIVPIKSFATAKSRLADVLTSSERAQLAQQLARGVLDAAEGCTTVVVSDGQAVLDWADGRADLALLQPQPGLNEALRFASVHLRNTYAARRLLICHSDLYRPGAIRQILDLDRSVIAPDRAGLGTNLLSVDNTTEFRFAYGPGSYARHAAALRADGRGPTLHLWNSAWANDVDTFDDLQRLNLI